MLSRFFKSSRPAPKLAKKSFFEKNEEQFFRKLQSLLPDCLIFPRIDVADLLAPVGNDEAQKKEAHTRLAGRKVDYAIFDRRMSGQYGFKRFNRYRLCAPADDLFNTAFNNEMPRTKLPYQIAAAVKAIFCKRSTIGFVILVITS